MDGVQAMSKKQLHKHLTSESRRWERLVRTVGINTAGNPWAEAWAGLMLRNYGRIALDYTQYYAKSLSDDLDRGLYESALPHLKQLWPYR